MCIAVCIFTHNLRAGGVYYVRARVCIRVKNTHNFRAGCVYCARAHVYSRIHTPLAFLVTIHLIPACGPLFIKAGLKGKDKAKVYNDDMYVFRYGRC